MGALRCSQHGATAIEYALIAGLLALGLVGSLVTTRGSLSAIFGRAGSQMASSSAGGESSNSTVPAGLTQNWAAKTVVSQTLNPNGTGTELWIKYSDNTEVILRQNTGAFFPTQFGRIDRNTGLFTWAYFDNQTRYKYFQDIYLDPASGKTTSVESAGNPSNGGPFSGNPPVPNNHVIETYTNGNYTSTQNVAVDQAWISRIQSIMGDYNYFVDLKSKM